MCVSEKSHARLDELYGHTKAKKIISILNRFVNLSECDVLDIGTGCGYVIHDIGKKCKSAASIDINDERMIKSGYKFKKINDEHIPFENNRFDIVISNHVIEHMPNQKNHISEIHRILKKDGVLYLATPNKYWIIDPEYKLPFISWLPRSISSKYLKIIKNKEWDIYPLSYKDLMKLTKSKFIFQNLTIDIIKHPKKYSLDVFKKIQPLLKTLPEPILKLLNPFVPTYIIILRKK